MDIGELKTYLLLTYGDNQVEWGKYIYGVINDLLDKEDDNLRVCDRSKTRKYIWDSYSLCKTSVRRHLNKGLRENSPHTIEVLKRLTSYGVLEPVAISIIHIHHASEIPNYPFEVKIYPKSVFKLLGIFEETLRKRRNFNGIKYLSAMWRANSVDRWLARHGLYIDGLEIAR